MKFFLALALFVVGCSSVTPQRLDPEKFYRRDLPFCAEDIGCFEGVTVLPKKSFYKFDIQPKGPADIDLLLATTCHREDSFEKTDSGWFIFKTKKRFQYLYSPVQGIEDDGICPLRINVFEKDKGRHSWSLVYFENPRFELPATVTCNGTKATYNGVSVCQSKVGLVQRIDFGRVVEWGSVNEMCAKPRRVQQGLYELAFNKGECNYVIRDEFNNYHHFGTVGYDGVLIREQ